MRDTWLSLGNDFSSNIHYLDAKMRPSPKYRWTSIIFGHITCNVDTSSCNFLRCLGLLCTSNVASIRAPPRGFNLEQSRVFFLLCHMASNLLSGQTYLFYLLKKKWQKKFFFFCYAISKFPICNSRRSRGGWSPVPLVKMSGSPFYFKMNVLLDALYSKITLQWVAEKS